jgi:hypothetical protein
MSTDKLLVVFGATGNQGGSVVDQFLSQAGWQIRALTRDPSSAKAQALTSRGVEVAHVDLDKPDSLPAALKGANAVFAVTDFWGLYGNPANKDKPKPGQMMNAWAGEHETWQLKQVIDAVAKVPTLERFILSSLSNSAKWSNGKYTHVYHFDSKAKAAEYAKDTYPELWKKTSIFQAGFFLSNYVGMMAPIKVRFHGTMSPRDAVDLTKLERRWSCSVHGIPRAGCQGAPDRSRRGHWTLRQRTYRHRGRREEPYRVQGLDYGQGARRVVQPGDWPEGRGRNPSQGTLPS